MRILENKRVTLSEAKKRRKKNKRPVLGWFQYFNPNAGDVEYNNKFFNHVMGSDDCTDTETSCGVGSESGGDAASGDGCSASGGE